MQRKFCTFSELLLASGLGYERDEIWCRAFIAHKLILILRDDAGTFCPVKHACCKFFPSVYLTKFPRIFIHAVLIPTCGI